MIDVVCHEHLQFRVAPECSHPTVGWGVLLDEREERRRCLRRTSSATARPSGSEAFERILNHVVAVEDHSAMVVQSIQSTRDESRIDERCNCREFWTHPTPRVQGAPDVIDGSIGWPDVGGYRPDNLCAPVRIPKEKDDAAFGVGFGRRYTDASKHFRGRWAEAKQRGVGQSPLVMVRLEQDGEGSVGVHHLFPACIGHPCWFWNATLTLWPVGRFKRDDLEIKTKPPY